MTVSVIIPYIESGDMILKTADSVNNQKKVNDGILNMLVVDITPEQDAPAKLSAYHNARVIAAPDCENEAQAYNRALTELSSDYAVFARPSPPPMG